jgi:ssDNA-binding Zn-finger/Zn-ribbon topoisomerase 1
VRLVCISIFEARKAVREGKYERYRKIAARNHVEAANFESLRLKGSTTFSCPKCGKGYLTARINKKDDSKFLGCTRFPLCKYTQKLENLMNDNKNLK